MGCTEDIIGQRSPSKWRTVKEYIRWFDETLKLVPTCNDFYLCKGKLLKPFLEEMLPLRHFLANKVNVSASKVYCKHYLGSQPYDARIIDTEQRPLNCAKIEFTQATDVEESWRRSYLVEHGSVPVTGPINKCGTDKKGSEITATLSDEYYGKTLDRVKKLILKVAEKKSTKDYDPRTWLVIWFHVPVLRHFKDHDVCELRDFAVKRIAPMVKMQRFFILCVGSPVKELIEIPLLK